MVLCLRWKTVTIMSLSRNQNHVSQGNPQTLWAVSCRNYLLTYMERDIPVSFFCIFGGCEHHQQSPICVWQSTRNGGISPVCIHPIFSNHTDVDGHKKCRTLMFYSLPEEKTQSVKAPNVSSSWVCVSSVVCARIQTLVRTFYLREISKATHTKTIYIDK